MRNIFAEFAAERGGVMGEVVVAVLSFLQNFNVVLICIQLMLCWHLPKRSYFPLRLIAVVVFIFVFCKEAAPLMLWREYGKFSLIPFFVVGGIFNYAFIIIFMCSVAVMMICFRTTFGLLTALCAVGYACQNFSFHVSRLFRYLVFNGDNSGLLYKIIVQITICLVGIVVFFVLVRNFKKYPQSYCSVTFALAYSVVTLIVVIFFSYWTYHTDYYNYLLSVFILVCNFLLVYLFYYAYMKEQADMASRKAEEMLKKGEWQYEFYKYNIETINRKCHDLKHEIAVLRNISDKEERESYITELEKAIMFYDCKIKTGNDVADILLNEKSMQCKLKGIDFSCVADGAALDFMKSADLSVFLGNSLDNAIEAELKERKEDRHISINIGRKDNIVTVCVENYFSGTLQMRKGTDLPDTTKADKQSHGYGLYSMRMIVRKYGGAMKIVNAENRFRLLAIFNKTELKK